VFRLYHSPRRNFKNKIVFFVKILFSWSASLSQMVCDIVKPVITMCANVSARANFRRLRHRF
jgi:hypothetical protein